MMKRDVLSEAVGRTAVRLGYDFHTGPDRIIPAQVRTMPAIWLSTPRLVSHRGRGECRDTYFLNLYFMSSPGGGPAAGATEALSVMEADAVELFSLLAAEESISHTSGLKCSPVAAPFTKGGEIALQAEMSVELFYFRQ